MHQKAGLREEVEKLLKSIKVDFAGIQETRNNRNSRETRKEYTWFMSGEGGREEYTAGVGIIIANKHIQHIEDIEPIDDRIMYMVLKGVLEVTILVCYCPPADRPSDEKVAHYEKTQKIFDKRKGKGPIYIVGDWNARLIYPIVEAEEEVMGKHTLHEDGNIIATIFTENMRENRDLMMEFCMTNELKVTNTMYRKRPGKIATYRKTKT